MTGMIFNREYEFRMERIPVAELRFWEKNPRITGAMYKPRKTPGTTGRQRQEQIYAELKDWENVRKLRGQIEEHGLMDPLIVQGNGRDKSWRVLEGSRRLAACGMIVDKATDRGETDRMRQFSSLGCEVVDDDLPYSHIVALISNWHISGKLPWRRFDKAQYVKQGVDELAGGKEPMDSVYAEVGRETGDRKSDVGKQAGTIRLMEVAGEEETGRYSMYNIPVDKKAVRKDIEKGGRPRQRWVGSISEWKKKNGDREGEKPAIGYGTAVNKILKDRRAPDEFRRGGLDFRKAARSAGDREGITTMLRKAEEFRGFPLNISTGIGNPDAADTEFPKLMHLFGKIEEPAAEAKEILEEKNGRHSAP